MQVFMSYAAADRNFARALSSQLKRRGVSVWIPEDEVLPGDNVGERIAEGLRSSQAMVDPPKFQNFRRQRERSENRGNHREHVKAGRLRPVVAPVRVRRHPGSSSPTRQKTGDLRHD